MRFVTQAGVGLIRHFESFSKYVYICPAGYPTIGYGHVVKEIEHERFSAGIDLAEAEEVLQQDILIAVQAVLRLITVPLTDNQFDALTSFTFNLGPAALQRSTLRNKVNREEHYEVPAEFLKWVWAGGKRLEGLIKRRKAEAAMYLL